MQYVILKITDIELLADIKNKVGRNRLLNREENEALFVFLNHLPEPKKFISERRIFDEVVVEALLDLNEIMPELHQWMNLFKSLPRNGSEFYPNASWVTGDEDHDAEQIGRNIIIHVTFVPSYAYSRNDAALQTVDLYLKTDGTAEFELFRVADIATFPDLYNFKGTWKEAYLLTVKTLKDGWPQTVFPAELEALLTK